MLFSYYFYLFIYFFIFLSIVNSILILVTYHFIFMYGGRAPRGELCNKVCMYVCMSTGACRLLVVKLRGLVSKSDVCSEKGLFYTAGNLKGAHLK